jgi:hypothetical protein
VESLLAVSNRLLDLEAKDKARRVLELATRADSLNQAALTRLIGLDLELGLTSDLERNITSLTRMRKPSLEVLERARTLLVSDQFVFLPDRGRILDVLNTAIAERRAMPSAPAAHREAEGVVTPLSADCGTAGWDIRAAPQASQRMAL